MKNLKILILAVAVLSSAACKKDFLDVEDLTSVTEQNFYRTPADAYKALVGCYDGLQRSSNEGMAFTIASEVLSDNAFGGTGNSDGLGFQMVDEFDKQRSLADVNMFEGNWKAYYSGIYRCNMLINNLEKVEWGTNTDLKNRYEAEARFLRAYMYFDLVRLFGNVPLLTVSSKENVQQASPEDVFKQIATDLKFSVANLAATSYANMPAAESGRVTKWAAEALVARVYLFYTGYYSKPDLAGVITKAEALSYLEDAIANSGHSLISDCARLWPVSGVNYAGEGNAETVFAIRYTYTSNYDGDLDGNHWLVLNGMRGLSNAFPYAQGWGGSTVNPKLWNAYAANDTRKTATIISVDGEKVPFGASQKADSREYTGYYGKKYTPLANPDGTAVTAGKGIASFQISQFQDYVSIRYADLLLMAAELGSPNAQQYFNEVRQRAYGSAFISLAVNQANIMNERRLEFALEGIRYWDLLRQGINVAAATLEESVTVLNGGNAVTKSIKASKVIETKGLQQIPLNQINLSNGILKQNAGW